MNRNDPNLRARMQSRMEPVTFGGGGYFSERMASFQKLNEIKESQNMTSEEKIEALKSLADSLLRRVEDGSAPKRDHKDMLNDAVGLYSHATDLDVGRKYPALLTNRALANIRNNKLEAAQSDCEAALELDPSWFRAYHRLALIAKLNEDWELAIDHTRKADNIKPEDNNKEQIERWETMLQAIPTKKREEMKRAKEAAQANRVVFFADEDFVSEDYKAYIQASSLTPDIVTSYKHLTRRLQQEDQSSPIAAMWLSVHSALPPGKEGAEFLAAAKNFIDRGGLFITLAECPLLRGSVGFDALCPGVGWKSSGYSRLSPSLNKQAVPPPPPNCPSSICVKSVWLDGQTVPANEQWYATKESQKMQSLVARDKVAPGQVGVAFHAASTGGGLMFIGDVNYEATSAEVAMLAIKWWKAK